MGSRPKDQNGSSQLPLVGFVQVLIGCATDAVVATVRSATRAHGLYTLTIPPLAFDSRRESSMLTQIVVIDEIDPSAVLVTKLHDQKRRSMGSSTKMIRKAFEVRPPE